MGARRSDRPHLRACGDHVARSGSRCWAGLDRGEHEDGATLGSAHRVGRRDPRQAHRHSLERLVDAGRLRRADGSPRADRHRGAPRSARRCAAPDSPTSPTCGPRRSRRGPARDPRARPVRSRTSLARSASAAWTGPRDSSAGTGRRRAPRAMSAPPWWRLGARAGRGTPRQPRALSSSPSSIPDPAADDGRTAARLPDLHVAALRSAHQRLRQRPTGRSRTRPPARLAPDPQDRPAPIPAPPRPAPAGAADAAPPLPLRPQPLPHRPRGPRRARARCTANSPPTRPANSGCSTPTGPARGPTPT